MFVFSGKDSFASYKAALEYAQKLASSTSKQLVLLNDEDIGDAQELLLRLDSVSLFSSGEVVLLKRPFTSTKLQRFIAEKIDKLKDLDLVIWQDTELDKRLNLTKELQKSKIITEFGEPESGDLFRWIISQSGDIKLIQSQAAYIVERVGNDKWLLQNEIIKLRLYIQATGESVTKEIIDKVFGSSVTGDIWKFLDTLTQGNKLGALQELDKMMAFEDVTQYILTMLNRELTLLAQVKSAPNPQALKMSGFVLKKTMAKAHKFSWRKLQNLARTLIRLDSAIKSGKVEGKLGLTFYLLSW